MWLRLFSPKRTNSSFLNVSKLLNCRNFLIFPCAAIKFTWSFAANEMKWNSGSLWKEVSWWYQPKNLFLFFLFFVYWFYCQLYNNNNDNVIILCAYIAWWHQPTLLTNICCSCIALNSPTGRPLALFWQSILCSPNIHLGPHFGAILVL